MGTPGARAIGGAPLAFGVLTGAQLGYTLRCRAPGVPISSELRNTMGASLLVQAAGFTLPPLRRVLGLRARGAGLRASAGFAVGFALSALAGHRAEVVVRRGPAARLRAAERSRL
jgi:Ca2+-transporting ATPase